uniref:Uncharacterized protein n=1 Tax=Romanomermis culicivorax TaxID=13658 RepID=A0A915I4L3_ROMCU
MGSVRERVMRYSSENSLSHVKENVTVFLTHLTNVQLGRITNPTIVATTPQAFPHVVDVANMKILPDHFLLRTAGQIERKIVKLFAFCNSVAATRKSQNEKNHNRDVESPVHLSDNGVLFGVKLILDAERWGNWHEAVLASSVAAAERRIDGTMARITTAVDDVVSIQHWLCTVG